MMMKGLILAGGESKRAGTDKGLKLKDQQPWAKLMQQKLLELDLQVKVSINDSQLLAYKNHFNEADLYVDKLEIPGPLKGILTAHLFEPKTNWLVLACDMLDMQKRTILNMIEAKKAHPNLEFYVYKNQNFYEPFCGIYTASGLTKLYQNYKENKLDNYSLQQVFKNFETYALPVSDHETSFNNYNK